MKELRIILGALILAVLWVVFVPTEAKAAGVSDLTFKLNEDGKSYCVSDCNTSASGAMVIPSTYNGKPVTAIGDAAFYKCYKLTSVTIPDSIKTIGTSAFESCSFDVLHMGKGVRTVGANAFGVGVDEVYITDLSAWCKIEWGEHSTPFGSKMFLNGSMLTKLVIPSDITVINDRAFRGIYSITSVTIHDKVTSIGDASFGCCNGLITLKIGDGVTEIEEWAFGQCYTLKNITWGKNITKVGEHAFGCCDALEEVVLPDSITKIPEDMFTMCDNLKKVTLGNKVTYIGDHAFAHGENLTSIVIPRTVVEIEAWAFSDCNNLTDVYYNGSRTEWSKIDFNYGNDELLNAKVHFTNPCADGHSFGIWTKANSTTHKRTCSGCGATETADHIWNSGAVTTPATCKDPGVKTFTCTGCGATKTETIEKLTTHTYTKWSEIDDSTHKRSCTVCKSEETASHDFSNARVTKNATCKEEGILTLTCICGTARTEAIPMLTAHVYDNSCDGECNSCGEKRDTSHSFREKWSFTKTSHWVACSVCGEKQSLQAHTPGTAPTADKAQTCSVCGFVIAPALGAAAQAPADGDSGAVLPIVVVLVVGAVAVVLILKKKQ